MLTVELRFPAGRYHATPWDQHVNEGAVEWPPSPWRLLRALVATWHRKTRAEVSEEQIVRLLEELSRELPAFHLPIATASHTRHYMPLYRESTTKVFDTFLQLEEDARLLVGWPSLELSQSSEAALDLLLARLGYLGRAESWVEARRLRTAPPALRLDTRPIADAEDPGPGRELVRVLAPMSPDLLTAWSRREIEAALERALAAKRSKAEAEGGSADGVELSSRERKKAQAGLPTTLLEALCTETLDLRKAGWSDAPGARWIDYLRPRAALTLAPSRRPLRRPKQLPTTARIAIASEVPPRLTEAVSVAERIRTALLSLSDGASVFSGKNADGTPAAGHRHAFFLPEANAEHGRITHVTLYAPMGFDEAARRAIERLRKVWGRDNHDLQLVPIAVGAASELAGLNTAAGECPLLVESTCWISRTPFLNPRHPKVSRRGAPRSDGSGLQVGSAEHELRRLLTVTDRPAPLRVEPTSSTDLSGKTTSWREFRTERRTGSGRRGPSAATGFRIEFPRAVRGPLALGYGAHFGLGLFVPVR